MGGQEVDESAMHPREIPYVGDSRVLAAIYGSLLVPIVGPALLILGSSIAYYLTRPTRPGFGRWVMLSASGLRR